MIDKQHRITYYVPVEQYWKDLEYFIQRLYAQGKPQEAEWYQHELGRVWAYNQATGSAYYPIYPEEDDNVSYAT